MTLAKRFITDHEIHLMAQAALDTYEMSADKNSAMQAAREYATDELGVLPRRSAVLLAYKLAMQGWDQIKFKTKEYIS